jgi:hypothetical protein
VLARTLDDQTIRHPVSSQDRTHGQC